MAGPHPCLACKSIFRGIRGVGRFRKIPFQRTSDPIQIGGDVNAWQPLPLPAPTPSPETQWTTETLGELAVRAAFAKGICSASRGVEKYRPSVRPEFKSCLSSLVVVQPRTGHVTSPSLVFSFVKRE